MIRSRYGILFCFLFLLCSQKESKSCCSDFTFSDFKKCVNYGIKDVVESVIFLNWNLLSLDTFKIIAVTFPFYGVTRGADEYIQNHFFDHKTRKNKYHPPKWLKEFARLSITPPIIYLGLQVFFADDYEMQKTAEVFLLGLPFVLLTKDIVKKLECSPNLRPYHEVLAPRKRCGGGFPSGHVAEAVYTAALFGMRFGPKYAVPLSIIAAFLGVVFIASNRHYTSQVVAGAAFGAMYAVAASKVVDMKLDRYCKDLSCSFTYENKKPGVGISLKF